MRHRRTIFGAVIAGLLLGPLVVLWNGKKITYVDSSGGHFRETIVVLGVEIQTQQWVVPKIGKPDHPPRLPWIKRTERPNFLLMQGALHYREGQRIVDERQNAEWERRSGD